jgi:Druantia protein DruA
MSQSIEIQGRPWQAHELEEIRHWVQQRQRWSRYRLSRELCTRWSWIRPNGQLADMAARSFLNKLHERALIQLPPCRRASPNRMKHRRLEPVRADFRPVEGGLSQLGPLRLYEVSRDPVRHAVFETLLAAEHYLGYRSPVGENLKYLLCTAQDRPVAAWLFGAAAWRCEARDRWIGWNDQKRAAGLNRLTNNTRFLIPRWVRVPGLASWGWSRLNRRLVEDWEAKYGHGVELVETFVDRSCFDGGAYAAGNWLEVGLTQGRSRGDREHRIQVPNKAVYVYPLSDRARQRLCQ